jgi:hypothetical protein
VGEKAEDFEHPAGLCIFVPEKVFRNWITE